MRRSAILLTCCALFGCDNAMLADGDPTGEATSYVPWPGPGPLDPAVVALLPQGVAIGDVRLGSDGCYYYQQDGGIAAVRWDDDPTHFYCIG